jgi:ATP phosphoribosyltransferase
MNELKMLLPKGRIFNNVARLLRESGFDIQTNGNHYVPLLNDRSIVLKMMKPQNIAELIELGRHDCGFTGYDWIVESGSAVVELLDLRLDPVKIVSAIPAGKNPQELEGKRLFVASEYSKISLDYLERKGFEDYVLLRTYGATEAFPPDDADMIIDNTSSGQTLKENNLKILDVILRSSTRFIASGKVIDDPSKRSRVEALCSVFKSVLDARERVILEMNVPNESLEKVVANLPCMKSPTVARLFGDRGFAVKIAIKRTEVSGLLPWLKDYGVTDILEYEINKVMV